jgi:purine nucleosidase
MPQKLIIDTDPGVDDMVAILAALHAEDIELLALTTVGGNVPIETTTANALRILARGGHPEIPVHPGLAGAHTAAHVHGDDGLSGCPWPPSTHPAQPEHAVDYLARVLPNNDITLACLGPLTNLAATLKRNPTLTNQIVLMGGGFGSYRFNANNGIIESTGNITPEAEFNIYSDIPAAQRVFSSKLNITVIPLDISQRTLLTPQRLEALPKDIAQILDRYTGFSRQKWGHHSGPLHDPNVIARIAEPDLYNGVRGTVTVTEYGQTQLTPNPYGPHHVMLQVDADGYLDWVAELLRQAPNPSSPNPTATIVSGSGTDGPPSVAASPNKL